MNKFLTALFLIISFSVSAKSIDIKNLNSLIEKNHAGWIAKENAISRLDDLEFKKLLGSTELPEGNSLFEDRNATNDSMDWRNVNGVNWLGPVMNQGNCGSCVAFAAVATLEATYRINAKFSWLNPSFSPQQLFSCGGGSCNYGWVPSRAASMLKNSGIVDAACSPYESGSTGENVQCKKNFCEGQNKRTYKISGSTTPSYWGGSAAKVKAALKKGPLLTTMIVYSDFAAYSSGIYKSVSKKPEGGHAVSLVGFNDEGRYWIVRNSWGSDWGENGFVRVSYDDKSGIGDSTWAYETAPENNYVSIASPLDHEYISGEHKIEVNLARPSASEIVINGESDKLNFVACAEGVSTVCQTSFDSTKLKDGRYEVYAKTDSAQSQVREFLVVNHAPQSAISFKGAPGVDLTRPLSGRIEFDIDVNANPVIPERVTFYVEDSKGSVVAKRVTNTVVSQMRLGFRTNAIKNGQYTFYYTAETPFAGKIATASSNREVVTIKN